MIDVLGRRRDINRHPRKCHAMIEAKMRMVCLQAKKHQKFLGTPVAKGKECNTVYAGIIRKSTALPTLDFELIASRNVRE